MNTNLLELKLRGKKDGDDLMSEGHVNEPIGEMDLRSVKFPWMIERRERVGL